jgi:YVTN family beta-propeller protein
VDAKRNRVFVANTHSNTVTVIDGAHNSAIKTLSTGKNPYALAVDQNRGRLYVALLGTPTFAVVDLN